MWLWLCDFGHQKNNKRSTKKYTQCKWDRTFTFYLSQNTAYHFQLSNRKFKVVPHHKCHFFLCSFSWTRLAMIRQPSIILIVRFECRTYFRIFHVTSLVSNLICQTGYEVMGARGFQMVLAGWIKKRKKEKKKIG